MKSLVSLNGAQSGSPGSFASTIAISNELMLGRFVQVRNMKKNRVIENFSITRSIRPWGFD